MNQMFNTYNMNGMGSHSMNYDLSKKSFTTSQPDSLFSMALYEFEAAQQQHQQQQQQFQQQQQQQQQQQFRMASGSAQRPGHFYPVDEYKDMSLREILDISDDFLFDDVDASQGRPAPPPAMTPSQIPSMGMGLPAPVTPSSTFSQASMPTFDAVFNTQEAPVTAIDLSPKKKRTRDEFETEEDEDDMDGTGRRFRPYQAGQWSEKFAELCEYKDRMGHCLVPHTYSENLPLARWVKRQRYQYKLMRDGKSSTMTEERVKALEDIGFVWDSQGAAWGERLAELRLYRHEFGHCNVPSNFSQNPQLATWVKCQRRQYKLHQEGKPSNMTPQRVRELENLGFEWELRSYKKARV